MLDRDWPKSFSGTVAAKARQTLPSEAVPARSNDQKPLFSGSAKRKGRIFIRPKLENKIFSLRCGVADLRLHYTHSNRVLHLTNANTLTDALSPTSHQYW